MPPTNVTASTAITSSSIASSSSSSSSSSAVLQHIQSHRDVPVEQLFTKLDIVGKGAYGAVYKGIHNATRTVLALKVINLDTAEDDIIEIQREVALLSQLRDSDKHNCIGYHGCYFYKTELWIAMDFASGGSIRTLLKPGKIDEKYTQLIIRETLIGLNYLHRQEIIHRDIKSANILLTNSNRVLLCDFGIAAPLQSTNHKRSTFIGTPYWMAPEVITDGKLYDTKADIWSLGITLYEMLNGNPPFSDLTPAKVILKIPRSQPAKLEGNQFSNGVKEFLAACLIDEPNDRPAAEELCKHKWIKSINKAPLSPLKDLTARYSRWINSGGVRQSLADISTLDQTNPGPESPPLDKADWDFMDDHELNSYKMDGINSIDPNDQSHDSKDGAVTLRPQQAAPMRPTRPHRLMKLFEEDTNENGPSMFNQFSFQHSYANPISPGNNSYGTSGQSSPIVGLGFPVPGMSGSQNDLRMEIPPPTISIPSTDELDHFLEPPYTGDPSNPNRPFSPSTSSYNRSITPTPSRLKHSASGTLSNKNKSTTDGSNTAPLLHSPPLGPDTHCNPSKILPVGVSPAPLPSSPSLPLVSKKESETGNPTSNRSRANTAPLVVDGKLPSTANGPALPSPMFNRGNFSGGNGGKQFGGNGFSFGGPSASSTSSSPVTLLGVGNSNESNSSYLATNAPNHASSNPNAVHSHVLSPDRERNMKPTNSNLNGYPNPNANLAASLPAGPSSIRSRSMADSAAQGMGNKLANPSLSSSVSSATSQPLPTTHSHQNFSASSSAIPSHPSRPTPGSSSTSTTNTHHHHHPVQLIPNWPTGERIKTHKDLSYHQLANVKDVKLQLEANLFELSRWLETCDAGLGLLIDSMK
ncbi:hypothetical protein PGT21_020750 [Puccinia graminis f. sp. tritici]|uniref:non-specific serine/threonine protein kinase n=2 Tax=Puccinia graminis f. sp. tritici TaxID=56615 RepID=A0A5B0PJV2_PUCGR|nr:hypothetical protein PGT21_020750 [Puccinia graminis f. sp. tritici]